MTALDQNPSTKNFLSPLGFKLVMKRAPNLDFHVQRVNVPSLSLNSAALPNIFKTLPVPGDHVETSTLDVVFKVTEDLSNWFEVYDWLRKLGKIERLEDYAELAEKPSFTQDGLRSEIVLMILDSSKNPKFAVTYHDAYPTSMSSLTFDSTLPDVDYLSVAASFEYSTFDVERVVS